MVKEDGLPAQLWLWSYLHILSIWFFWSLWTNWINVSTLSLMTWIKFYSSLELLDHLILCLSCCFSFLSLKVLTFSSSFIFSSYISSIRILSWNRFFGCCFSQLSAIEELQGSKRFCKLILVKWWQWIFWKSQWLGLIKCCLLY